MNFYRTALLQCSALLYFMAPAFADAQDEPQYAINFRFMAMERIVKDLCYIEDGEVKKILASRSRPSGWEKYQGSGAINFYFIQDIENRNEDEEWPAPAVQFNPMSSGDWLLLFTETAGNGARPNYRIVPIPDQTGTITSGLRFYNLTKKQLAIKVNNSRAVIKPGQQRQLNPDPNSDTSIVMQIAASGVDQWKMVSSKVFSHRPNTRTTFYLIDTGDRIRFKRFVEGVPL